jgi:hypothetical protein
VNKAIRFCTLALLSLAGSAVATTPAIDFARKHKSLYASQVRDGAVLRQRLMSHVRIPPYDLNVSYDDRYGTVTLRGLTYDGQVHYSCIRTGSGTRVTPVGVAFSYVKESCDKVVLRNAITYLRDTAITVNVTPAQFAELQARGIDAVFEIALETTGEIVRREQVRHRARLSTRAETHLTVYTLGARAVSAQYFFIGSKTPFYTAPPDTKLRTVSAESEQSPNPGVERHDPQMGALDGGRPPIDSAGISTLGF